MLLNLSPNSTDRIVEVSASLSSRQQDRPGERAAESESAGDSAGALPLRWPGCRRRGRGPGESTGGLYRVASFLASPRFSSPLSSMAEKVMPGAVVVQQLRRQISCVAGLDDDPQVLAGDDFVSSPASVPDGAFCLLGVGSGDGLGGFGFNACAAWCSAGGRSRS